MAYLPQGGGFYLTKYSFTSGNVDFTSQRRVLPQRGDLTSEKGIFTSGKVEFTSQKRFLPRGRAENRRSLGHLGPDDRRLAPPPPPPARDPALPRSPIGGDRSQWESASVPTASPPARRMRSANSPHVSAQALLVGGAPNPPPPPPKHPNPF